MIGQWIFYICICLYVTESAGQGYTITPITTSSGLYYEKIGEVLLSNNNWEFVTSVDYAGYLLFYEYLHKQANELHEFCQTYKSTYCQERFDIIRTSLNRIDETDETMANFLGITTKNRRVKRFWSEIGNFFSKIGRGLVGAARVIFGGGGEGGSYQPNLAVYDRQIGDLQQGQRELENKVNLQTTLFMVDSERKNFQIKWLQKTQGEIQDKIGLLEKDFQKDSEEKEKEIKELKNMLDETNMKLDKQAEAQKKLTKEVDQIQNKLLKVNNDIKEISQNVKENKQNIDTLELKVKLNSLSIDFNFLMTQFEIEQNKLFAVIKNAKRGDLDPYVLTPLHLIKMLQDIQENLPEDHKFPVYPNIENARNLYNIIKPDVYLYNNKIIFILKIPLVNYKKFNIHKMTSFPIPVGKNKFAFILPQDAFLVVDNNYQNYLFITSDDFRNYCEEIIKGRYLCKQIQQISQTHSSNDCEMALFTTSKNVPNVCDKRAMYLDKTIFIQLQKLNSWIYVAPETENLIVSCDKERHTVSVEGTGFVAVADECTVRTIDFLLTPIVEFTKPVESNYSAQINLTNYIDFTEINNLNMPLSKRQKQVILPYDFEYLEKISISIIQSKSNTTWVYYFIFVCFMIIIAIVGFLIYKKKINMDKMKQWFDLQKFRVTRSQHIPSDDRIQLKVKLNKKQENIQDVSIYGSPSTTDPEAEYMTVKFKINKDKTEKNQNAIEKSNKSQNLADKNDFQLFKNNLSSDSTNHKEKNYLNELRKLKPAPAFCKD